jgi:primosomal protein N' (replication factor Y)
MKRYFEVAVPLPLRKNFTYFLPETLSQNLHAGMRILVPFGSREVIGYVISEQKEKDIQIKGEKVKGIKKILDEEILFDEEILHMARWASDYYICPLGEMIRAALPSGGGKVADRKTIKITDRGFEELNKNGKGDSSGEQKLLQLLKKKKEISSSQLKRQSNLPNFQEILKSLLEKKLVEAIIRRSIFEPKEKVEICARIAMKEGWTINDYKESCKNAVRQIAVLELLLDEDRIFPYSEIKEKTGAPLSVIKAIKKKGLVHLEMRKICRRPVVLDAIPRKDIVPNREQKAALEEIKKTLDVEQFRVFLLKGVTGSGKTEVYLRAIESALKKGRDALYLVPEISLTPMLQREITGRFGDKVSLLHSALTPSERFDEWLRAKHGEAVIVLGARSAVFAPLQNLGLIIIDEEQDPSYKQEESPRYNARDLALIRARERNIPVVMGSATPSMESYTNARSGKFTLLELKSRVEKRPLPEVRVVDMKEEFKKEGETVVLSEQLKQEIDKKIQAGEQVLILLNRRGFSSFVQCRDCGEIIQCPRCSLALTYHKISERLSCHHCGYWKRKSETCPSCGLEHLLFGGEGTEKLEETINQEIRGLRIGRLDRDTVRGRGGHVRILRDFESGKINLLVGTQMIAKGHDFPSVTLVGVISADRILSFPDFRASERTFQLITQVSGRAGRGDNPGHVIIQAYYSGHYAIQTSIRQNFEDFYEKELRFRKVMKYPPFSVMANIIIQNTDRQKGSKHARKVAQLLRRFSEKRIVVMGPSTAPIARIRKNYRFQVVLRAQLRKDIKELFFRFFDYVEKKKMPIKNLIIDVDPVSMM